jgi:hypothetical protein
MPIDVRKLGRADFIRRGGVGEVSQLLDFTLPGHPALAYKRFIEPMTSAHSANLRELIAFRDALSTADRALLDDLFTWPLDLVVDGPAPIGFVMDLLPPEWFHQFRGDDTMRPRDAQWLLVHSAAAARKGVVVPMPRRDDLVRLVLCAKLARAFTLLHRAGIVYGDLHSENVIFQLHPMPRLRIVDCDAARARVGQGSASPAKQMLHWVPPEGGDAPQTVATDCYKLGLFVLRCLADGPHSSSTRKPARAGTTLGPGGLEMLSRAVGTDPARRPSAKKWYVFLRRLINDLTQPPRVESVRVSEQIVLTGTRVMVEWDIVGATSLTILTSDGVRLDIDAPQRSGSARITVTRTGPIEVIATNDHGTSRRLSSQVSVFETPKIAFVNIAEPVIPVSDLGIDRRLAGAITSALAAIANPATIKIPDLPNLVRPDLSATIPQLSMDALDTTMLPLIHGFGLALSRLSDQAYEFAHGARHPQQNIHPENGAP